MLRRAICFCNGCNVHWLESRPSSSYRLGCFWKWRVLWPGSQHSLKCDSVWFLLRRHHHKQLLQGHCNFRWRRQSKDDELSEGRPYPGTFSEKPVSGRTRQRRRWNRLALRWKWWHSRCLKAVNESGTWGHHTCLDRGGDHRDQGDQDGADDVDGREDQVDLGDSSETTSWTCCLPW